MGVLALWAMVRALLGNKNAGVFRATTMLGRHQAQRCGNRHLLSFSSVSSAVAGYRTVDSGFYNTRRACSFHAAFLYRNIPYAAASCRGRKARRNRRQYHSC